jgi:hypothetical protein
MKKIIFLSLIAAAIFVFAIVCAANSLPDGIYYDVPEEGCSH